MSFMYINFYLIKLVFIFNYLLLKNIILVYYFFYTYSTVLLDVLIFYLIKFVLILIRFCFFFLHILYCIIYSYNFNIIHCNHFLNKFFNNNITFLFLS